eukprot:Gregarina_sp_Pseudo_9__5919@NODE_942_length_2044_cov_76_823940_g476_i1_p1_GENE_NODE_942_length_2044_cov_76_823940_g476_i1NODE_942_length_2044_cov_76_823940_g476_i1_p1_ORF_typecomplete_len330_score18_47Branch/PF02485_21/0_007_NODE_942_length_2044_cov_76_823940_g476_i17901779
MVPRRFRLDLRQRPRRPSSDPHAQLLNSATLRQPFALLQTRSRTRVHAACAQTCAHLCAYRLRFRQPHTLLLQSTAPPHNVRSCRLALEAYRQMPTAEYFLMVSENTMPLEKFSDIFQALRRDRRIRTSLIDLNFAQGLPKTSAWRAEPRETVELRLNDLYWTIADLKLDKGDKGYCHPDECLVWKPIKEHFQDDTFLKFYFSRCEDSMSCFMMDCWKDMTACKDSGKLVAPGSPFRWQELNEGFLLAQLRDPNRWMLRQVEDSVVVNGTGMRLDDYFANHTNSNYKTLKVELHPAAKQDVPRLGKGSIYENRRQLKQAQVYGLRDNLI